eukprot:CAMPEP_0179323770 /NCGR_PEP_ID=MMETSP0797-20121207/59906_1 /TAXON_ID=47934 /ORGANISM="Dinophysis acuminata, Strain DAEP01" /LENGTH=56 /DNA_ID=CAMNT_0021035651 /DNA_START=337 /DNA_END=504 /DNA_ORIENTATION=+
MCGSYPDLAVLVADLEADFLAGCGRGGLRHNARVHAQLPRDVAQQGEPVRPQARRA